MESLRRVAEEGRRRMTNWAGLDEPVERRRCRPGRLGRWKPKPLAMEANAAAATGDYRTASRIDRQLAHATDPQRTDDARTAANGRADTRTADHGIRRAYRSIGR